MSATLPPLYPPPQSRRFSKWWLLLIVPAVLFGIIVVGLSGAWNAGFRAFTVPGSAMAPTIQNQKGDHIIANMAFYQAQRPKDQDIILFTRKSTTLIKRIIASGGEVIEGKDGLVYINGKMLNEPYVQHLGGAESWMDNFGPITIPSGQYFVMGDNRDLSFDSRSSDYGTVPLNSIVGKPLFVLFNARSKRTGKEIK